VAACISALGGGAAMGRYTDISRHDLNLGCAGYARAAMPAVPPAPKLREPKAKPFVPEGALAAVSLPSELHAEAEAEPEPEAEPAPERDHDPLGKTLADGLIMRGATPHRLILFTFDDGPDRSTTPRLLDRLDAAGARAVFFLTGSNLRGENVAERTNLRIAKEAVERGHWLASHGMNHKQLPLLSDAEALAEIVQVEQVFERVLGGRPFLFRPPGGAHSPRIDRLLAQRGYTTMLWNIGAGDFQVHTAADVHKTWAAVHERREAQGERGGIVLLHDTYPWSVEAFQLIVDDLLARNCELLERGEELYELVDDPSLFYRARGSASASAEAPPVVLPGSEIERRQERLREETAQRCSALAMR
jgi:peptidoglycan/xylan/chitin deacetylase (PgdA/CDA1 family)